MNDLFLFHPLNFFIHLFLCTLLATAITIPLQAIAVVPVPLAIMEKEAVMVVKEVAVVTHRRCQHHVLPSSFPIEHKIIPSLFRHDSFLCV